MRALSLTEPWASLVVMGEKKIETRSWKPYVFEAVAIHASKGFPKSARNFATTNSYCSRSLFHGHFAHVDQLPLGEIIGTAEIVGYLPTEVFTNQNDETHRQLLKQTAVNFSAQEREFGNYSENRFGWILRNPLMLKTPIPCKGALGLWKVPADIEAQIINQLGEIN